MDRAQKIFHGILSEPELIFPLYVAGLVTMIF